jgi:peroxiredoxin-like protein
LPLKTIMTAFPHHYAVEASGTTQGDVTLTTNLLPVLRSASPLEFGGPGDRWSPETLLMGAVADCFILTFRAIAVASKLPWESLRCVAVGTLDRVDRVTQFTHITLRVQLTIPADTDANLARRLLERAEGVCLITSSLKATTQLEIAIDQAVETVDDEAHTYAGAWE